VQLEAVEGLVDNCYLVVVVLRVQGYSSPVLAVVLLAVVVVRRSSWYCNCRRCSVVRLWSSVSDRNRTIPVCVCVSYIYIHALIIN